VWLESFPKAVAEAAKADKPILVDCWAAWCKPCKKLFDNVLTAPQLRTAMEQFVLVKLDTEASANEEFVKKHEIGDDLPWVGFFDAKGNWDKESSLSGEKGAEPFASAEAFAKVLEKVAAKINPRPSPSPSLLRPSDSAGQAPSPSPGWLDNLEQGFEVSRATGKPLLVDGWAKWCTSCLRLKSTTFPDPAVSALLADFVTVALDMDAPKNEPVWDRYDIKGLPWVALFQPGEQDKPDWVLTDFEPPPRFAARLRGEALEQDDVAAWLAGKGLLLTLLLVFLAGMAASLTPCAYPTYILIFGFFSSGRAEGEGKRSPLAALALAALLVLGMAVSYSAAGMAAALGGGAVGRIMTNPWVMGAIAVLFVGVGASSLSVLPPMEFTGLKSALHSRQKSTLLWAFIFGLVMGLVVAPCVGPILIGILTYIASAGNVGLGLLLMTTFALGMGVLFFAMALFSHSITGKIRMGTWSEAITVAFGIMFFAAAFYYLKGIVPFEKLFALFEPGSVGAP
jgi:thiol:disulfide interchange protein